ncbi:hypothetical protein JHK87_043051 [Glycine soja]|nr:hypothetical protein JHK87_043051 [Glycine soja]
MKENGVDYWHVDRNEDLRVRVLENDDVESESQEWRKSDGVRSWLYELGLSRSEWINRLNQSKLRPQIPLVGLGSI